MPALASPQKLAPLRRSFELNWFIPVLALAIVGVLLAQPTWPQVTAAIMLINLMAVGVACHAAAQSDHVRARAIVQLIAPAYLAALMWLGCSAVGMMDAPAHAILASLLSVASLIALDVIATLLAGMLLARLGLPRGTLLIVLADKYGGVLGLTRDRPLPSLHR